MLVLAVKSTVLQQRPKKYPRVCFTILNGCEWSPSLEAQLGDCMGDSALWLMPVALGYDCDASYNLSTSTTNPTYSTTQLSLESSNNQS
jgi:hypothetical protein